MKKILTLILSLSTFVTGGLAPMSAAAHAANHVQQLKTPGGFTVWLVESHQIPMVSFEVAFRAGSAFDPAGKEGTAHLTASLMDEGAGDMDANAFKEALDDIGARLGGSAGTTTASVSLDTLSQHATEAFRLLALALTSPRFDTDATARIKDATLTSLQRQEENPSAVAARLFKEAMFPNHPYGHATEGTLTSVPTLTAEDARGFYQRHYTKANMVISVVGDIKAGDLIRLVDTHLASLPKGIQTPWPKAPASIPSATVRSPKATPQSSILIGRLGVGRDDPRYYPTIVMNEVLGGGVLTSRLFDTVREKNGLAYHVYSRNTPLPNGTGIFSAGVQTNNDTAKKALALIRQEFETMRTKGLTDTELADIKSYLVGSFPLRLDSNSKILSHLTMMQMEDLGPNYLTEWPARVEAVTKQEALEAAQHLLDFSTRTLVIVGDGAALDVE